MSNFILPAPNKDAILKALEVAQLTPEAAAYVYTRLSERLSKVNIKSSDEVLAGVNQYRRNVEFRFGNRVDPWRGNLDDIRTDFQNAQFNIAVAGLKEVGGNLTDGVLKMDFALSDQARLLRAFSINSQAINTETALVLDNLFNAWLAENEMVNKDSVIYEADTQGRIKEDKNGNPIKVNVERIRQLIADRDKGFGPFLNDKFKNFVDHNLNALVQKHHYPETPVANQQPVKPATQAQNTSGNQPSSTEPEPTPETPTSQPDNPEVGTPITPEI